LVPVPSRALFIGELDGCNSEEVPCLRRAVYS
jgi:hypothetical protein